MFCFSWGIHCIVQLQGFKKRVSGGRVEEYCLQSTMEVAQGPCFCSFN
jgi:hypothetical protein